MDHLPCVRDPLHPPIEVPYVVLREHVYDGLGLLDFPQRMNLRLDMLDNQPQGFGVVTSWLQSFCFFAFVIEVLKVPGVIVVAEDFIRVTESGQRFITTSRLPSCLWLWAVRVRNQARHIKARQGDEIMLLLVVVHNFVMENFRRMSQLNTRENLRIDLFQDPFYRIMLSIVILGETLTQFFTAHYGIEFPTWPPCWFLSARMLQAGWCPYEITLLTKKNWIGNAGLYYLSSLKRLHTPERHSKCSRGHCGADQINEKDYQTKHEHLSCTCQHRMGDIDICEIVSQGKIPLYSVTSTRDGGCDIRVEAFDPKTRYVAISHVWSNGLGNPRHNSLPQCQLLRLQDLCNALYESKPKHQPIPFWIDTLCVPIDDQYRKQAIANMASIYSGADKVLVLDETLMQTTIHDVELQEPLLQILCSSWSRRLWTFQEGVLSKSLHFQFRNRTLHQGDVILREHVFQQRRQEVRQNLGLELAELSRRGSATPLNSGDWRWIAEYESVRVWDIGMDTTLAAARYSFALVHSQGHSDIFSSDYKRLAALFPVFKWRTTSKPEDEAICMAVLLGQETSPLSSLQPPERIKKIILSLSRVPSDMLFLAGTRFEEEGQRWIPTSFFNQFHMPFSTDKLSSYSSDGLNVEYNGYLFCFKDEANISPTTNVIYLLIDGHQCPYCVYAPDSTWDDMDATLSDPLVNGQKIRWHNYISREMAIILRPIPTSSDYKFGVLVTIQRQARGTLFTRFESTVMLEQESMDQYTTQNPEYPVIRGKALPSSQKWCVG